MANITTTDMHSPLDWAAIKAGLDAMTTTDKLVVIRSTDTVDNNSLQRISTTIWLMDNAGTPTYIASRTTLTDNSAAQIMANEALQAVTVGYSEVSPEAAFTAALNSNIPT